MSSDPITEFKQGIKLKVIDTILTRETDIGHGESLAVSYPTLTGRKIASRRTVIIIVSASGSRPAETRFLITRNYARFIIVVLEKPALHAEIVFIGIIDIGAGMR